MIRQIFMSCCMTFFILTALQAQDINSYKYVIVPESYDFLKGVPDKYQLNSLTKFLFKKQGFTVIMDNEDFPEDLRNGGCKALRANVENESSMFTIKLKVALKDCNNKIVFTTGEGSSKNKDYKAGYHEALRNAFMDIKKLNYHYEEPASSPSPLVAQKREEVSQPTKTPNPETMPVVTAVVPEVSVIPETPVKSTVERLDTGSTVGTDKTIHYTFNGSKYSFKKEAFGFELLKITSGTATVLGKIHTTSRDNNYIVKAADLSGNGYFDSYGNFILERINPVTAKLITDTFAREDQ